VKSVRRPWFLHSGYKFYWNLPGIDHIYFWLDENQLWRSVFLPDNEVLRKQFEALEQFQIQANS